MISAVILTHNDEDVLSRCLQSLTWCDEVIVVDDESRDGTVEIAKKFGAKEFHRKLNNDFASQRNFGLETAKGEWVLFVDSDEEVSQELASEIKQVTSIANTTKGYYLNRKDVIWGRELKFGETANVKLLRLAKKAAGIWERPVHEVWNIKGKTAELGCPLLHYPHPNVAQFLSEINRYSTLNAQYLYAQKKRASIWQIVGYPAAKFFLNYFWYQGFRDGVPGAVMAIMMSFHSFLTRAKLWQLWQREELMN